MAFGLALGPSHFWQGPHNLTCVVEELRAGGRTPETHGGFHHSLALSACLATSLRLSPLVCQMCTMLCPLPISWAGNKD